VSAELEIGLYVGDHIGGFFVAGHPFFENVFAGAFFGGGEPEDDTAVTDGVFGVVEGLLCLIEIDVFGKSAGRYDDDVGALGDGDAVHAVEIGAAGAMGLHVMAGDACADVFVLVEHDIDDEIDRYELCHFLDVFADGISGEGAGFGGREDHFAVVGGDGAACGDARHDGLCTAAVSCKIVKFDVADADAAVRTYDGGEDLIGGAPRAGSDEGVIVHRINAGHAVVYFIAGHFAHFGFGMRAVDAQRKYDGDIFFPDAGEGQTAEDDREDLVGRYGARDVARDDRDGLSRVYGVLEPEGADRVIHGVFNFIDFASVRSGGDFVRLQDGQKILIRQVERDFSCVISKIDQHTFLHPVGLIVFPVLNLIIAPLTVQLL